MKRAQYSTGAFPPPWTLALLPGAFALQWMAAQFPEAVERLYARGLYRGIAFALGRVSGLASFSVGEVLVGAVLAWLLWRIAVLPRALRRAPGRRWRRLGIAFARGLAVSGIVYSAFLLLWGLNYHRQPFAVASGLGAPVSPAAVDELAALCGELVDEANAVRAAMAEDARGVGRVAGGLDGTLLRAITAVRAASTRYPLLAGPFSPAKPVLLSAGLSHLGISGIYVPFTAEANVNTTLPDSQVPFSACHELAHQGGVAREDEANFVAYLSCRLYPHADFRYSGALNAALYALGALRQADPAQEARQSRWSPAVRRDLAALAEWHARYRGPAQRASRAVNHAYLKAHGQPAGVRSYGRMVDLLILERRAERRAPASD